MLPLWDSHKLKHPGDATRVLVTLNLLVFGGEMVLMLIAPDTLDRLIGQFGLVPAEWWGHLNVPKAWIPVFSAMFLHGGVAHVAGNCWFLWIFGRSLEDHLGTFKFLLIYGGAGVGAAWGQTVTDTGSLVPMIGASGAISGVLGAYFVSLSGRWIVALVPWIVPIVPLPAFVFLVMWFGIQLLNGVGGWGNSADGGVAWWAHVGGFASGVLLSGVLGSAAKGNSKRKKRS